MQIDLQQLEFMHPIIRRMVADLERHYGVEFTVTSLYRMNNETSVHGVLPTRGVDLRCYDKDFGTLVCKYLNESWRYDPSRLDKVCGIYHDVGQGAHIHVQCSDKTTAI